MAPSLRIVSQALPGFLSSFLAPHRQVYKNLQEVNAFIRTTVWRRSVKPWTPVLFPLLTLLLLPDFIDSHCLLGYSGIQESKWGKQRGEKKTRGEKGGERSRRIG